MESNILRTLKSGALTALVALAPLTWISAADASKSPAPAAPTLSTAATTNAAPVSGTTNAAPVKAKSGFTITTDDDDEDGTPSKPGKHSATITIGGDSNSGDGSLTENLKAIVIPIVAIVVCVGGALAVPVLIVFFICYFKYKRRQENLALAKEYLAKGQAIPPELLDDSQKELFAPKSAISTTAGADLRRGFKLAFTGLGVAIALYVFSPGSTMFCWGLIPMVMGIGLVVSGAVQTRMESSRPTPPPVTPTPPEPPR